MFSSLILKDIQSNKYQGKYKSTYNFYFKLYIDSHIQFDDKTTECTFIDFLSDSIEKVIEILHLNNQNKRIHDLLTLLIKISNLCTNRKINENNILKINNYLKTVYESKIREHLKIYLNSENLEFFDGYYSIKIIFSKLLELMDKYLKEEESQNLNNLNESIMKYINMINKENIINVKLFFYL